MLERLLSLLGIVSMFGVAWLLSVDRRSVPWRAVIWGTLLQLLLGVIILLPAVGRELFDWVDAGIHELLAYVGRGADFVFQSISPHEVTHVAADGTRSTEVIAGHISPALKTFAFWILPSILFFSALMALLYHYGVMQRIVDVFSIIMQRTMGTSGAESLAAAANIFLGQTEAPLVVRPYVRTMTVSELNAVMVPGFAGVAGGVMAVYVGMVHIPGIAGHLAIASIMSAPAALALAKVMVPEKGEPETRGHTKLKVERLDVNGIDALSRGALEGLQLALNVAALLIVFVAFIAMINALLGLVGGLFGIELSLEGILGWVFSPMAFLIGIPWSEAHIVGQLMGEKMVLTELLAFAHLGEIQASATPLSERSAVITSYALCGFANFASIGIQIGGIGGMAPERRGDLARLGFRAMIGGTLASNMTGAVAGLLYMPS